MFFKLIPSVILPLVLACFIQFCFAQSNPLEFKRGHQGWLNAYALSPVSNKYLVTAGSDNQLIIWDYANGKQIRAIKNQTQSSSLVISVDDRFIFSTDAVFRVKKWDLMTGKLLFEILAYKDDSTGGEGRMEDVEINNNSKPLGRQEIIEKRYLKNNVTHRKIAPSGVEFDLSSNGQWLITASHDHKIKIWDAKTGKLARSFSIPANKMVNKLLITKDMKHILVQDTYGEVQVYAFDSGKFEATLVSRNDIAHHNISRDQQYIYCLSNDLKFQIFRIQDGQNNIKVNLEKNLYSLAPLFDENVFIGQDFNDTTYHVDIKTGKVVDLSTNLYGSQDFILDNKNQLLSILKNKRVVVYDPKNKSIVKQFGVFVPDIQQAKFSDDGFQILVNDGGLNLTKVNLNNTNKPVLDVYPFNYEWNKHIARLSPDSKKLFVNTVGGDIYLWNLENPDSSGQVAAHYLRLKPYKNRLPDAIISDMSFAPDGQQIILTDYLHALHFINPQDISIQIAWNKYMVKEYNLIRFLKDSKSVLINAIDHGYGEFYQLGVKDWSPQSIKAETMSKKFTIPNINDRLVHFEFTDDFKYLIYLNEKGEGGIQEVENGKKLFTLDNCQLVDWFEGKKQHILLVSQKKVMVWDVLMQKIKVQYDLPFSPLDADINPKTSTLLLTNPDQSLELRNAIDGKLLFTFVWQAGTSNFQLKDGNGKLLK